MAIASAVVVALTLTPSAGAVKTSNQFNTYRVPGTTARALVNYMLSSPYPGDHGGAFANIRPQYKLSIKTKESGGMCRVQDVDVDIRFVITLPEAADASRMSKSTRSAWNNFAAFARRHEEVHRASYTACAKAFVAAARRQKGGACYALTADIRQSFAQARRDCEAKQSAFDRSQKRVLSNLRLFNMAGY